MKKLFSAISIVLFVFLHFSCRTSKEAKSEKIMTSPSSIDSVKMVKETPAEIYLEDMPEIIVADSLQDEFFIIEHKGAEPEVIDSIKTRINKSKR